MLGWLMGFEPTTTGITIRDSTAELQPPSFGAPGPCSGPLRESPTTARNPGAPDRFRTCYPRLRRPVLYPDELRAPWLRCTGPSNKLSGSGWRDSNPRHLAPKASALPDCATPRRISRCDGRNYTVAARETHWGGLEAACCCCGSAAGGGGGAASSLRAGGSSNALRESLTRPLSSASRTLTFTIWPSLR
jgi:hypothetical protein